MSASEFALLKKIFSEPARRRIEQKCTLERWHIMWQDDAISHAKATLLVLDPSMLNQADVVPEIILAINDDIDAMWALFTYEEQLLKEHKEDEPERDSLDIHSPYHAHENYKVDTYYKLKMADGRWIELFSMNHELQPSVAEQVEASVRSAIAKSFSKPAPQVAALLKRQF